MYGKNNNNAKLTEKKRIESLISNITKHMFSRLFVCLTFLIISDNEKLNVLNASFVGKQEISFMK